jgi:hypothetical protein
MQIIFSELLFRRTKSKTIFYLKNFVSFAPFSMESRETWEALDYYFIET